MLSIMSLNAMPMTTQQWVIFTFEGFLIRPINARLSEDIQRSKNTEK